MLLPALVELDFVRPRLKRLATGLELPLGTPPSLLSLAFLARKDLGKKAFLMVS